jgi:hypothetical protein
MQHAARTLRLQRKISDHIYKGRPEVMHDSAAAKMYVAAIPELAKLISEGSGLDTHHNHL